MAIQLGSFVQGQNSGGTFSGKVDLLVTDGAVPLVDDGADVRGSSNDPAARITAWEEDEGYWEPTDIRVARLVSELTEIEPLPTEEDGTDNESRLSIHKKTKDTLALYRPVNNAFWQKVKTAVRTASNSALSLTFGEPSPEQMQLINKYRPQGASEMSSKDVCTIPWLASHTLMQYGGGCWAPEALTEMAFGAPGRPMLLDHKAWDVSASVGFIYECHLVQVDASAINLDDDDMLAQIIWASSGQFYENNLDTIRRNGGVYLLVMETAHEMNSPFVQGVRAGRIRSCSTGCYLGEDSYCCPICTDQRGIYTPMFGDTECPHLPSQWFSRGEIEANSELEKMIAPYIVKTNVVEYDELSAVNSPGLPGARVL